MSTLRMPKLNGSSVREPGSSLIKVVYHTAPASAAATHRPGPENPVLQCLVIRESSLRPSPLDQLPDLLLVL